jgi:pimeloyl-ACP methyl ester carboxylesterase
MLAALFALLLIAYVFKSFTPPIFGESAIAELKAIDVNGDRQFLLIRGHDRASPVLVFLHGGPGMPAMYLAHDFQRDLERHFVVVHWDQRASGKSFKRDADPESLSISGLLSDTDVVIEHLRESLGARKVWLVGHSHGTYLGALYARRHPDKVRAYVGLGQIGDFEREHPLQDAYLETRLADLGYPPHTEITGANREDLLFESGSELYGETSFVPLLLSGLAATEYSLFDIMNVSRGPAFSGKHMKYDMTRSLIDDETAFEVPVAIIMGAHDMVTPVELARGYYDAITAPEKRWLLFDKSAHFPFFEEPERFTAAMLELEDAWR